MGVIFSQNYKVYDFDTSRILIFYVNINAYSFSGNCHLQGV